MDKMENIIEIKNFSKSFEGKKVINNISFSIKRGEIFAYLGSNGSGKTTTIRSLLNIYSADEGDLHIFGKKFSKALYNKIGYLPEERGLYLDENIGNILYYFAKLRGLSNKEININIEKYLKKIGLEDKINTKLKNLSSGQQQKVQFGVAILHNPEILILDEPMKGLDPVNRQLFTDMILEQKALGTTILFSSHQMEDVEKMADSLVILKDGKIGASGSLSKVKKEHGKNTIKVNFEGKFPRNKELYTIKNITNNFAELAINEDTNHQEILKYFINEQLIINKFELSDPSLNDIFISINRA